MQRLFAGASIAFLLMVQGCTLFVSREPLPYGGRATTTERLERIVRQAARNEEWSSLYDLIASEARDKISRLEWELGFSDGWRIRVLRVRRD